MNDQTGYDPTYQYHDSTLLRILVVALGAACAVLLGIVVVVVRWLLT